MGGRADYYWDLLCMLTRTEFRLRDQGTWFGFLWTMLHPLFLFAVLYLLFMRWMAPHVPGYAAYLLIGIVQWNFFASATTAGLTSLQRKAGLIASYSFPRVIIVLACVAAVLLSHLLEWAVLLAALLFMGVRPTALWLALPLLIGLELALVLGLSGLLAVCAVSLRDLERVWGLLLYGFFFLTPVFYASDIVGDPARGLLALNPLAMIIGATRAALTGAAAPAGGRTLLLAAALVLFCAASLGSFGRLSRGIAERL